MLRNKTNVTEMRLEHVMEGERLPRPNKGITRDSLSGKIYDDLRSSLMTGAFEPGERLNIRRLASDYDTSPTPVREAVMQLVREGGLELRPGHELRVPVLSLERYIKIREVRAPLERLAAELAASKITKEELSRLAKANENFMRAEKQKRWKEALAFNKEFHFTIYGASRNDVLVNTIENLWLLSGPFINNQYPSAILEHDKNHPHTLVVDALRRGAAREAGKIVVDEMMSGSCLIIEKVRRDPTYSEQARKHS